MTTKTDITLPPLPRHMDSVTAEELNRRVLAWGRAAVEADRQGRMPSDEEIESLYVAYCRHDGLMSLEQAGKFARALLSRYSSGQSASSAEPSGYAYRYPDGIRFNDGREVNGCKPTETLPYWFGAAPVAQSR